MARTFLTTILCASTLFAQAADQVKLDTPQAKAVALTLLPHLASPAHAPLPFGGVIVFLSSGRITLAASGGAETIDINSGDFRWLAGATSFENAGDGAIQLIEIELKAQPQGPLPATDLDPIKTDPEHYKTEFENDQVRVLRVRYGPHEKGALHEHKLNRVVCYVTDHPGLKAGSVRIAGPATHNEENRADYAVERVAVELK